MRSPTFLSPLAEIVATWAISSGVVTGFDKSFKLSLIVSTANITPETSQHKK
jgi:hypothetical protein